MYRKILLNLLLVFLLCSTAMAAPVMNLEQGKAQIGYTYQNFDLSLEGGGYSLGVGSANTNNLYLQYAASQNITLGVERTNGSKTWSQAPYSVKLDTTMTDIYLQYGLDPKGQIRLMIGNRNYDTSGMATDGATTLAANGSTSKFFGGLAAYVPLGTNLSAYTTYKKSSLADDWEIGAQYNFSKDVAAVVQYRTYKEDMGSGVDLKLAGAGFGIAYKF